MDLRVDLVARPVPGWFFPNEKNILPSPENPQGLRARFESSSLLHHVLGSSGVFDNVDARVDIHFLAGDVRAIRAGMLLRHADDNSAGYGVFLSANGRYRIASLYLDENEEIAWRLLQDWVPHSSLRAGLNQVNRLRVILSGTRIQVFLNGTLGSSFSDLSAQAGALRLVASASDDSPEVDVVFSDFVVYTG